MVSEKGVRYREVSAIKHVRYREVPLYSQTNNTTFENNFEIFVWSLGKNGLVMIDDRPLFQALEAISLYWKNGKCGMFSLAPIKLGFLTKEGFTEILITGSPNMRVCLVNNTCLNMRYKIVLFTPTHKLIHLFSTKIYLRHTKVVKILLFLTCYCTIYLIIWTDYKIEKKCNFSKQRTWQIYSILFWK